MSARFEQDPRAADVRLKRAERSLVSDAHDGLRGEVKDGIDLILVQCSLDQRLVADVAVDHVDPALGPFEQQRGGGHGVAFEHADMGAVAE